MPGFLTSSYTRVRNRTLAESGTGSSQRAERPASWWRRGDILATVILIVLPALVFGLPAMLGHSVAPGDDLLQNYPLRVLAGRQLAAGHLPLFDPYIWSGAPLLADWNAGAAYPLTLLFAVMPGVAAWALNLIGTYVVAGLGMFWFLRAQRLGTLASFLGALTFAFAGAMPAQVGHFGLVAGLSWVPLELLAVFRLTEQRSTPSILRWVCVLATAFGLTILAGEPRAIDDAAVIVLIYAAWRAGRLGRDWGPAAIWIIAGLGLGACLGAVQWLPGLSAVSTSQRAVSSWALYASGSLPPKWLLMLFVPDVLGGSGSFGQPAFLPNYNLAEVTSYVGILPLVAAMVLLGRLKLRSRPPEWLVWHLVALAGIVCALGGNTPLGHLLVHLPLFGNQRLQSRNVAVLDLALAVLLAYWADDPSGAKSAAGEQPGRRREALQTALGLLPPLAVLVVIGVGVTWPAQLVTWLGVSGAAGTSLRLVPGLGPYALFAILAAGLVIFGHRLRLYPKLWSRLLAGFVAADIVVFTVFAVVAVAAGSGATAAAPAAAPPASQASTKPAAAGQSSALRPVAALGYSGRYAIYDPGLLNEGELAVLRAPDINVLSSTPSAQGYSSLVDGLYAAATGSHSATGEGQDVLAPSAVANGTLARLNTSALLTMPQYLVTSARDGTTPGPAGSGGRDIAAGQQATWFLGTALDIARVEIPDSAAGPDAAGGAQIGLMAPGGSTSWLPATADGGSLLSATATTPVPAVAVIARAGGQPARLGPAGIVTASGGTYTANGQLQNALLPPHWGYAGSDGSFAVFADHDAHGVLSLVALSGRTTAGASVTAISGPADDPTSLAVRSPAGVRVIRSVAAIPGWTATWQPRHGSPMALTVDRAGVIQSVAVPAGSGIVTFSYSPPGLRAGLALSAVGLALILALAILARRRGRRSAPPGDHPENGHTGNGNLAPLGPYRS